MRVYHAFTEYFVYLHINTEITQYIQIQIYTMTRGIHLCTLETHNRTVVITLLYPHATTYETS
jgi:hypothetical protein